MEYITTENWVIDCVIDVWISFWNDHNVSSHINPLGLWPIKCPTVPNYKHFINISVKICFILHSWILHPLSIDWRLVVDCSSDASKMFYIVSALNIDACGSHVGSGLHITLSFDFTDLQGDFGENRVTGTLCNWRENCGLGINLFPCTTIWAQNGVVVAVYQFTSHRQHLFPMDNSNVSYLFFQ